MARVCRDCGLPLLVKNTAVETNTWSANPTYRCKDCQDKRVQKMIEETRRALGLETIQENPRP